MAIQRGSKFTLSLLSSSVIEYLELMGLMLTMQPYLNGHITLSGCCRCGKQRTCSVGGKGVDSSRGLGWQYRVLTHHHPSSSSPSYPLGRLVLFDVPSAASMTPRDPIRNLSGMVRQARRQPSLVSDSRRKRMCLRYLLLELLVYRVQRILDRYTLEVSC